MTSTESPIRQDKSTEASGKVNHEQFPSKVLKHFVDPFGEIAFQSIHS
jgi:hypothetical protein